ncbi:hypothetical protein Golob_027310 [Gossypium lobatum]|uniref:RNase H type-1 domain-containing protein n=1 Tax=Gossypium lobatum TaxID=34289 RepID=A0A7J8NFP6_9ROSI|nr:hypothetical protein [Gossypium lobatum]
MSDVKVAELINTNSRLWKKELIESTFLEEVVDRILLIPLAVDPHDDLLAWSGKPSGDLESNMELSSFTGKHATKEVDKHYNLPESTSAQCRIFCCTLWAIWGDRNAKVHKKVSKSGKEIVNFVHSYILELNEIETRRPKFFPVVSKWKHPPDQYVKINFDAAYDERSSHLTLGIVARNSEGKILLKTRKCRFEYTPRIANCLAHSIAIETIPHRKSP